MANSHGRFELRYRTHAVPDHKFNTAVLLDKYVWKEAILIILFMVYLPVTSETGFTRCRCHVSITPSFHGSMHGVCVRISLTVCTQGPISQTVNELPIDIFHSDEPIHSQFCICHGSFAIVACEKLWPDVIIIFHVRTTQNFERFGLLVHCLFVKCFPDLLNNKAR